VNLQRLFGHRIFGMDYLCGVLRDAKFILGPSTCDMRDLRVMPLQPHAMR
jgi:hypothetical protein